MLNYLSEINSPLYQFLCYNPRVNELTSTNPYPKIKTYVLSLYDSPLTYLGDQLIPLSTKMTSLMLSNNLINKIQSLLISLFIIIAIKLIYY